MSNSELFLIKDDDQDGVLEFDILKSHGVTAAAASSSDQETSSTSSSADANLAVVKDGGGDTIIKQGACQLPEPRRLGEFNAAADEDDDDSGFTTPTSMDNQIPGIKQCPAAPRKPKPTPITAASTKRKLSSSSSSASSVSSNVRRRRLDLSQEVNSLFPKPIIDDLHRKIKKARTDHHHHDQRQQEDEEN